MDGFESRKGRGGAAGVMSALMLFVAALFVAAQTPLSSSAFSRVAVSLTSSGGMGVANNPATSSAYNRVSIVSASKLEAASIHKRFGGDDTGLPSEILLPAPPLAASLANARTSWISPSGLVRCYDACGPPHII
jgi:hypothetical protein